MVAYRTSPNCGAGETGDRVDALTTRTDPASHLTAYPLLEPGARTGASTTDVRVGMGIGADGDPMYTLQAGKQHGVAVSFTLTAPNGGEPLTFDWQAGGGGADTSFKGKSRMFICDKPGRTRALTSCKTLAVQQGMSVRRLLPVECLKLQSFPPDYLDAVTHRGTPLPDGARYKLIGNSWNVEVVRWIFNRIDKAYRGC